VPALPVAGAALENCFAVYHGALTNRGYTGGTTDILQDPFLNQLDG